MMRLMAAAHGDLRLMAAWAAAWIAWVTANQQRGLDTDCAFRCCC